MIPVSVVMIVRDEEDNIVAAIQSAKQLSNDIIVVDTGSEDQTIALANNQGVRVIQQSWMGYGHARNKGAEMAKHDWIFSLDADERLSPSLITELINFNFSNQLVVGRIPRRTYFENKLLKFGTPSIDKVTRLYNRKYYEWDKAPVHENLLPRSAKISFKFNAHIEHYGIPNLDYYEDKCRHYAILGALKYHQKGIRPGYIRKYAASAFGFFKSYFLLLGFLDGKEGFLWAKSFADYTWMKYKTLEELNQLNKFEPVVDYKT